MVSQTRSSRHAGRLMVILSHRMHLVRGIEFAQDYSVLIFSSLSRLPVIDSSTELDPLIHSPPPRRRM